MRVLILEDEVLTALELADSVRDLGYEVIGPCFRVKDALEAVEAESPDFALLDFNVGGTRSVPVVERLRELGTPFVILSGYRRDSIAREIGEFDLLSKPVSARMLEATLEEASRSGMRPPGRTQGADASRAGG